MVRVRLVCKRRVGSVHPIRFRWGACLHLHWACNHPPNTPSRVSDPRSKDETARPRYSLFSFGKFAVSGLPKRVVLLHVACHVPTSADHIDSPSNPSRVPVLASIPPTTTE